MGIELKKKITHNENIDDQLARMKDEVSNLWSKHGSLCHCLCSHCDCGCP